jgi:hypothetical protein
MKTRNIFLHALFIISLNGLTGCETGSKLQVDTNTSAPATSNANQNTGSNDSATVVSDNQKGAATPTEAAQAMFTATRKKDIAALKKQFSADSIKKLEEAGKQTNKSIDEVLETLINSVPLGDTFGARNEVIDGDKATVEMSDKNGKWTKNSFVKENGSWKISIK